MQTVNTTTSCAEMEHADDISVIYTVCYRILLPLFTANGVLGNVLNLIVLRAKRVRLSMGNYEKRTNYGLIALAVSDMLMCLFAFPTSLVSDRHLPGHPGFSYYYQLYCKAVISVFIMSSTWITVTLAAERYLAICHAFKAQSCLKVSRTLIAIAVVFLFSVAFNCPYLWKMGVQPYCHDNGVLYYQIIEFDFASKSAEHMMRVAWAVIGNFIPLILLGYFNFRLMFEIHKAYKCRHHFSVEEKATFTGMESHKLRVIKMNSREQHSHVNASGSQVNHSMAAATQSSTTKTLINQQRQDMNFRITLTLVAIVIMFLILVAPSEAVKHILYLVEEQSYVNSKSYQTAEIVTNTMQTLNFSVNFIIYCCIIKSFRRTIRHIVLDRIIFQGHRVIIRIRKFCNFGGHTASESSSLNDYPTSGHEAGDRKADPRMKGARIPGGEKCGLQKCRHKSVKCMNGLAPAEEALMTHSWPHQFVSANNPRATDHQRAYNNYLQVLPDNRSFYTQ